MSDSHLDYEFESRENWIKLQRALNIEQLKEVRAILEDIQSTSRPVKSSESKQMKTYYVSLTTHEGILLDRFEVAISSDVPMSAVEDGWDVEFVDSIDDAISRRLKFQIEGDKQRTK